MKQEEIIHLILKFINEADVNKHSFTDIELSDHLKIKPSFIRDACRTLIENNDVINSTTKDGFSICKKQSTLDAFETEKYLKKNTFGSLSNSISGKNIFIGDNYGSVGQSSSESDFDKPIIETINKINPSKPRKRSWIEIIYWIIGIIVGGFLIYEYLIKHFLIN